MHSPHAGIEHERYVDADAVAAYAHTTRRQVLQLTRAGKLPAHPLDPRSRRKQWRYKLSEIDAAISVARDDVKPHNGGGSPRSQKEKN